MAQTLSCIIVLLTLLSSCALALTKQECRSLLDSEPTLELIQDCSKLDVKRIPYWVYLVRALFDLHDTSPSPESARQASILTESICNKIYSLALDAAKSSRELKHDLQDDVLQALNFLIVGVRNDGARGPEQAARLFYEAKARLPYVLWSDTMQLPAMYNPSLRAMPWWDIKDPALDVMVAKASEAIPIIRAELKMFLKKKKKGAFKALADQALVASGSWTEVVLWQDGVFESVCTSFPETCRLFTSMPLVTGLLEGDHNGQITILKMTPGTHLRPHTSAHNRYAISSAKSDLSSSSSSHLNSRLLMHVPVIIPDGVKFRVANQTRHYDPEQAMVFDDSFEHEVWHQGTSDGYVVYATMHHPDLAKLVTEEDYSDQIRKFDGKSPRAKRDEL
eukprot:TRINITY_DN12321_c1_g2_i2.p1 TRINITY_DN12321_c1_g2~~TRINITY_DN12321_c1_g2_i2.p1  ORF type:complete len:446 (+),score=67.27 TRINITY_DN12321_c1_g2_i2:163-1338(+)